MKTIRLMFSIGTVFLFLLAACSPSPAAGTPTAAETPTAAGQDATTAMPDASPTPAVDPAKLSEEALAETTDDAISQAIDASQDASETIADGIEDGTITEDEAEEIEAVLTDAADAVLAAEALILAYDALYGEYASETIAILLEMEEDLETIAQDLLVILDILEGGAETASTLIEQIETVAETIGANATGIQTLAGGWLDLLQSELDGRVAAALAVQATEIATDRRSAIRSALDYVELVRSGLADGAVSPEELAAIAQTGANAVAGLDAVGGAQLQDLVAGIDALTELLARGELPQALLDLESLASSIPRLP